MQPGFNPYVNLEENQLIYPQFNNLYYKPEEATPSTNFLFPWSQTHQTYTQEPNFDSDK
jgi:hypothetical protein